MQREGTGEEPRRNRHKGLQKGLAVGKVELVRALVRPSPAPDHHSQSHFLVKSFLHYLLDHLSVSHGCECCKDQVPVTGGTSASRFGGSARSQMGGAGTPGLGSQLLESVESRCSCWSRWGSRMPATVYGRGSIPKTSNWGDWGE